MINQKKTEPKQIICVNHKRNFTVFLCYKKNIHHQHFGRNRVKFIDDVEENNNDDEQQQH